MMMKYIMDKTISQRAIDTQNAQVFLNLAIEKYVMFDKVEKGYYLSLLEKTIYDAVSGV